jgi:hypothetical protein
MMFGGEGGLQRWCQRAGQAASTGIRRQLNRFATRGFDDRRSQNCHCRKQFNPDRDLLPLCNIRVGQAIECFQNAT